MKIVWWTQLSKAGLELLFKRGALYMLKPTVVDQERFELSQLDVKPNSPPKGWPACWYEYASKRRLNFSKLFMTKT